MELWPHQAYTRSKLAPKGMGIDVSDPGCVSADTEYLTPTGWRRIDQYSGGLVAQFDPASRSISFVAPHDYVKAPCASLIAINPARGTSQRLSHEHRVLFFRPDGSYGETSAAEFVARLRRVGANHNHRKFATGGAFRPSSEMPFSDTELRVLVAVIADGHFSSASQRCAIRLKKPRKINRIRALLSAAGISYNERTCGGAPDFQVFTFTAPARMKHFDDSWWSASEAQRFIIADEVQYWDSSINANGNVRFCSTDRRSADFVQFVFATTGNTASLSTNERDDGKPTTFDVHVRRGVTEVSPGRADSITEVDNPEGFKYCFGVETTYWLARHDGHIFATGNTGKTSAHLAIYGTKPHRGRCLVTCPSTLMESAWAADIDRFFPGLTYSLAYADTRFEAFEANSDIVIMNVDGVKALTKKFPKRAQLAKFLKDFDHLIMDECFVGGTFVDTPSGARPIETIQIGDLVITSNGPLPVTNTFAKLADNLVFVELDDGTTFECTENHPFATTDGWCEAGALRGMCVVRLDIREQHQSRAALLRAKLREKASLGEPHKNGACDYRYEDISESKGAPEPEELASTHTGRESPTPLCYESARTQLQEAWREWGSITVRADGSRDAPRNMVMGGGDPDETTAREWVPNELQSRFCQPSTDEGSRNRRGFAQIAARLGCQEDHLVGISRVVRVSRLERGNPRAVYNLQVDGPHDYSVAHTLVHNCDAYKHHTSARSRSMLKVSQHFDNRYALSATPNPQSVTELWHPALLVDRGARLGTSFSAFRNAMQTPVQVGLQANHVRWQDKENANELAMIMLEDILVRHSFEEVMTDVPPNHTDTKMITLPAKLMRQYGELERTMRVMAGDARISVTHASSLRSKLLQLCSGALYAEGDIDGEGDYVLMDGYRYALIADLVEERDHSVTFFNWRHQRIELEKQLTKRGVSYEVIDGSVDQRRRPQIVADYQAGKFQTLLVNYKTGAHGLTLTRGTTSIICSPIYEPNYFKQTIHRIYRGGQTQVTNTLLVCAKDTVEELVYEKLRAGTLRMEDFLRMVQEAKA